MRVRLLAFASAGDALGATELDVELGAGARVADLRTWLDGRYPRLMPLWPRLAVAVNGVVSGPEEPLAEGAEVALLPPVSGGSPGGGEPTGEDGEGAASRSRAELVESPIDLQAVAARVAAPGRGATVLFLGTVRDRSSDRVAGGQGAAVAGRRVVQLTYTAYRPMALAALGRIAAELEGGEAGLRVAIVHRLGAIAVGEASVAIATAAPHRAAAYEANRRALERLKAEVPIWKREQYEDGEAVWREEEPLSAAR
jgi:molybdopterin synthase catalytic subunit